MRFCICAECGKAYRVVRKKHKCPSCVVYTRMHRKRNQPIHTGKLNKDPIYRLWKEVRYRARKEGVGFYRAWDLSFATFKKFLLRNGYEVGKCMFRRIYFLKGGGVLPWTPDTVEIVRKDGQPFVNKNNIILDQRHRVKTYAIKKRKDSWIDCKWKDTRGGGKRHKKAFVKLRREMGFSYQGCMNLVKKKRKYKWNISGEKKGVV